MSTIEKALQNPTPRGIEMSAEFSERLAQLSLKHSIDPQARWELMGLIYDAFDSGRQAGWEDNMIQE